MTRIATTFERLRASKRSALIPFFTAGDPHPDSVVPIMQALVRAGADILELGVPFSDPMADGPVIQRSSERALKYGIGVRDILRNVAEFRRGDKETPVVLMGYANPIEHMGVQAFADAAAQAGVDGVLVVDYPPEEGSDLAQALARVKIDSVHLLAPTSSQERIELVARTARGYVYYVSLKGVTGAGNIDLADVARNVERIKQHIKLPVGVGFGIRDGATARAIAGVADAVVVGSRIVQEIEGATRENVAARVERLVTELRRAMDAVA
jgi:tryptophan synthase alpha chain